MSQERSQSIAYAWAAGVLLLLHAWMVLALIPQYSATYNEPGHLCSGLACWYEGNYDFYGVNPPFAKMVATLPILGEPSICLEMLSHTRQPLLRREVEVGRFFADTNAFQFQAILCRARIPGVLWITLGGWIVWRWTSELYGPSSALLALSLWTLEPTLTAHAALATPDVPATVMAVTASYVYFRSLRSETWRSSLGAGVLLGIAILCKFTLIILVVSWIVPFVVYAIQAKLKTSKESNQSKIASNAIQLLMVFSTAWLVICAGYGFAGLGTPIGELPFASKSFRRLMDTSLTHWIASVPSPVPTGLLIGMDLQQQDFEGRVLSYLRGEWRWQGWWYYYLYAFAIKTPIGHLLLYVGAVPFILLSRLKTPMLLWLVPLLVFAAASAKWGLTNHLRYVLPAYPFLMVLSGAWLSYPTLASARIRLSFASLCLACSLVSTVCNFQNSLGYFNEAVGGCKQGWLHLADSNVNWGQDWILLRDWLESESEPRPIHLDLIGHVDYQIYLHKRYPRPRQGMSGLAIVDAHGLTNDYRWLQSYPIAARIGSSIFVFEVLP